MNAVVSAECMCRGVQDHIMPSFDVCGLCCCWCQGREDGLEMVHWVKGYKDANGRIRDAHEGDYPFAKYNKKVRAHMFYAYICVAALDCTLTFTTSMRLLSGTLAGVCRRYLSCLTLPA